MDVIARAEALGGYRALSEEELFEFEYWDLEQAKLRRAGKPPVFAGEIALVTGAASGIGKACVEALLKRGAAVVGLDIDPSVATSAGPRPDYLGLHCDITSAEARRGRVGSGRPSFRRIGHADPQRRRLSGRHADRDARPRGMATRFRA